MLLCMLADAGKPAGDRSPNNVWWIAASVARCASFCLAMASSATVQLDSVGPRGGNAAGVVPMRRWLLMLLLIVLAGAASWLWSAAMLPPGAPSHEPASEPSVPAPAIAKRTPASAADRAPVRAATDEPAAGRSAATQILRVRAVDRRGEPVVGITVWFALDRRNTDGAVSDSMQALPPTRDDGTTELPDAAQQLAAPHVVGARLFARILGADGPTVAIAPHALPTEVLTVTVPDGGRVHAELRGADGSRWLLDDPQEQFHLAALDANGRPEAMEFTARPVAGGAQFAAVALGRRYRLWTAREWAKPVEFAGPDRPGATVVVPLAMRRGLRLLAGRLLGPDGAPWPHVAHLAAESAGSRFGSHLMLDANGRFVTRLDGFVGELPRLHFVTNTRRDSLEALVVPNGPLLPGLHELGDVMLQTPPVLVAGRLQWDARSPHLDTFDGVALWCEWSSGGEDPWFGELQPVQLRADGTFACLGHPLDAQLRLCIGGSAAPREPVRFVAGQQDLQIAVATPSRIEATFLLDAGTAETQWQIELEPLPGTPRPVRSMGPGRIVGPGGPGGPGWPRTQRRSDDRLTVAFDGLAAGSYWLQVQRQGAQPVVRLQIEVPWSAAATDPRLREIDLRGR